MDVTPPDFPPFHCGKHWRYLALRVFAYKKTICFPSWDFPVKKQRVTRERLIMMLRTYLRYSIAIWSVTNYGHVMSRKVYYLKQAKLFSSNLALHFLRS